jgi:hypothetical protein
MFLALSGGMTKTFVAINDPVHSLIRQVTRHTPLCAWVSADRRLRIQYGFRRQELPEAYYSLAMFHALGGLSLKSLARLRWRVRDANKASIPARVSYFDAVKLDRRCARDLRRKLSRQGPGMLAGELLAFGVGTLRARNDDPQEHIHQLLWKQHGRIETRHEIIYATIRALHWNSLPLLYQTGKESFDSTNVIYGDVLGELEQLWERRADTVFLEQVTQVLQRMGGQAEVATFLHPPLNPGAAMKQHYRAQAVWRTPPVTARALLRRLECVLEHTLVDSSPHILFRWRRPERESAPVPKPAASGSGSWETDWSGYDGWLAESASGPVNTG